MNYLIIACASYLLNAVAVTIDKILLVKQLPNPALYVFYISLFSLAVLFLMPFTSPPSATGLLISSFSTILWTMGAYFMFRSLKSGDAVRVIPVIGTLIPVILLLMSSVSGSINLNEVWAVIILLFGLIFLILPYLGISPRELAHLKGKFTREEILLEIVSALFFANSYFLLKAAYDTDNFLSIFVYSRLILIPIIIAVLATPKLRQSVLAGTKSHKPFNLWSKTGFILFIGQMSGGASQMLLTFAISLANPAVVNSIQGIQYVFLFLLSVLLSKRFPGAFQEKISRLNLTGKIIGIVLIFLGLWVLSIGSELKENPKTGLTFSPRYARDLGLDPEDVYQKILTELHPSIIRLPVYWDEVEKNPGEYDFSEAEDFVKLAAKENVQIILVVGFKQPRWPECFQPDWSRNLRPEEFNEKVLDLVRAEVEIFKLYSNVSYWQVENEPLVEFGICPKPDRDRLMGEIQTVKNLDNRPVLITDSGELSTWIETIAAGDALGTTLYRSVWSPIFGSVSYPIPPLYYRLKANFVKFINGLENKPIIISELQAEPWPDNGDSLPKNPLDKQIELFPKKKLIQNFEYAKYTGLEPVIFWGAEWWYFMKQNGIPDYWENAKSIFKNSTAEDF